MQLSTENDEARIIIAFDENIGESKDAGVDKRQRFETHVMLTQTIIRRMLTRAKEKTMYETLK